MLRYICFVFLVFILPSISHGAGPIEVQWEDLVPTLAKQEDPLAALSEEEKGTIEWVMYIRANMDLMKENQEPQSYQNVVEEMKTVLAELQKKGIDLDRIIAERQRRASAVNTELDGKTVKLAGYILPLDISGNKVTDFLLVPFVGACIHVPPPPPNQIVSATTTTTQPYELEKIYEPVWITGELTVQSLSKELFLSDGTSDIDVGYEMKVLRIESFEE